MSEPYFHIFDREAVGLGEFARHTTGVDIAAHGPDQRRDTAQAFDYAQVTHVAGVPYLVAALEVECETVVPATVGVGKYAYALHLFNSHFFSNVLGKGVFMHEYVHGLGLEIWHRHIEEAAVHLIGVP